MAMIEAIEQRFSSRPLVLFHEDLQTDPFALIDQLCAFTGAHYQREQVNLSIVHSSWSDKQLKLARLAGKRLFDPVPRAGTNPTLHRIRRRLHLWACYGILGVAQMVPSRWVNPAPLINPESLSRVREVFANDWLSCHDYAQTHNPPVSGINLETDQTL
jgi:hypothetical protein